MTAKQKRDEGGRFRSYQDQINELSDRVGSLYWQWAMNLILFAIAAAALYLGLKANGMLAAITHTSAP
jgi:hypothetical protein